VLRFSQTKPSSGGSAAESGPLRRHFGATLSPFGWIAFIGVVESEACRGVAREERVGESGFELPRTVLGRMSIDVGLMLAQALPQIVGGANVEMTGHSNGFKNVNVVHR
jgi:hypothetical protein